MGTFDTCLLESRSAVPGKPAAQYLGLLCLNSGLYFATWLHVLLGYLAVKAGPSGSSHKAPYGLRNGAVSGSLGGAQVQ